MPKDLAVAVEDRPGQVAGIGEALGEAGINIEGTYGSGPEGVVHVLVEDAGAARSALEGAGFNVAAERDVIVLTGEDRPGWLGSTARKLANAGVNIDLHYGATNNRVVFVVDDLDKARSALGLS